MQGGLISAERYRAVVESLELPHIGSTYGIVTMSIGITDLKVGTGTTIQGWLAEADAALYAAKHAGRNCVVGSETASV